MEGFLTKGEIQHAPEKLSIVAYNIEGFLFLPVQIIVRKEKLNKVWDTTGKWK